MSAQRSEKKSLPCEVRWSTTTVWTDVEYAIARRLMRQLRASHPEIALEPPDFNEEVIHELLVDYPKKIRSWSGRGFQSWLRRVLYNKAIDLLRRKYHTRSGKDKPRVQFVSLDEMLMAENRVWDLSDDSDG